MAELDDRGRDAADGLLAKVTAVARAEAARAVAEKLNNVVEGGRLNWEMLTQWGHRLLNNGVAVPIRPKLDLVGFTVADDPAGDLTRVTGGGGGGGGGGMTKVAEVVVGSSDHFQGIRLPLTGTLPAGKHLLLMGQARTRIKEGYGGTPAVATNVWVSYNDDPVDGADTLPAVFYSWEWHSHDADNGIHLPEFTNSDIGIEIGYCSGPGSPANYCSSYRVDFQNFSGTAFQNGCTFQSLLQERNTASRIAYEGGGYRRGPEAITSLTVFTNSAYEFAPGTIWSLYLLDGAGSGGGSGDWVELTSHTVPAGSGEGSMDFPSLPQTYRSLVAVGDNIQYVSYSAVDGKPICFLANAWNGNDYVQRIHRFGYDGAAINDVVTPTPGNSGAIGYAPGPAGDEPVSSFVCWFPGYTNTTKYKTYHGHAEYSFGSTTLGFDVGGFARLALASHINVDQLTFYANYSAGGAALDLFAPGSRITIYGVR